MRRKRKEKSAAISKRRCFKELPLFDEYEDITE